MYDFFKTNCSLLHHCDEESSELFQKSPSDEDETHLEVTGKIYNSKKLKRNSEPSGSNTPTSESHTSASLRQLHSLEQDTKYFTQYLEPLTQQKEEDDVDLFMKSIALTLKKLPSSLIPQAKLQILKVVTNLQESSAASTLTSDT